ncbi:MAG: Y-family DNA polymerase [Candidatus Kapabacteria bacterium]|nr:Y-family DNA polymerase [Candidatus Kapabacteria bacterium]
MEGTVSKKVKPVALVDCNNFYASCERVFNPKLWGKPIVVLSNNDGMIIARSNEAKELGIKMGEPLFKAQEIIKKHNVHVFSSNYTLYGDMSHRVMTTLEHFSPDVEIYSIDEAFINLEGFSHKDLTDYCRLIRNTVRKWTGIPVSIGIAETKTLAKLANRFAKKVPSNKGVLNLYGLENKDYYLKNTEVADIWGVGRQYTKLLNLQNIFTAYDFANANEKWIKKKMTVMGLRTALELKGIPCIEYEYFPPAKKAIVSSRSFGQTVQDIASVKEAIAFFVTRASEKMRAQKSSANLLSVFLRTNPFKKEAQYHNGVLIQLPVPTDSTSELISYAMKGVEQIFRIGYKYYKVGVMLSGLVPTNRSQTSIFDTEDRMKMAKITEVVDEVNKKMGSNTLFYAATGINRKWRTRADMRTPKYTTDWDQLPLVSAKEINII